MTIKQLPPARYKIERIEIGKERYYLVDTGVDTYRMGGVTSELDIIGGQKTRALMAWNLNEGLARIKEHLTPMIGSNVILDEKKIESIIASAKRKPKDSLKQATDYGTEIHAILDALMTGRDAGVINKKFEQPLEGFLAWSKAKNIRSIAGDTKVASLVHFYAGALDAVWEIDGELVLVDYKSSRSIREETPLQCGAYWQALTETHGVSADSILIIRVRKEPVEEYEIHPYEPEVRWVENPQSSLEAFLVAKDLRKRMSVSHFAPVKAAVK